MGNNGGLVDLIGKKKRKYLSFTIENQGHVLTNTKKKAFHFGSPSWLDHALCGLTYPLSTLLEDGRTRAASPILVEANLSSRTADYDFLPQCLGYRPQISTQRKKLLVLGGDPSWSSPFLWTHRLFRAVYPVWRENACTFQSRQTLSPQ